MSQNTQRVKTLKYNLCFEVILQDLLKNEILHMKNIQFLFIICLFNLAQGQQVKAPIMGWSSWNNFRVHIDEKMIREQADAMVSNGLFDVGYRFVNIDDGYFKGRDSLGYLIEDKTKFPSGMKALADYIHSKGLKAGIYSDAGRDTCGSIYDDDKNGIGAGMYAYLNEDVHSFFKDWKYDFLKVDWCGGQLMNLDEETEYTKIIKAVKVLNPAIVFNVCRWEYPGEWVEKLADSWRISSDIQPEFSSILRIIDINAHHYQYASPGHYNDMDMLQVGRGMSYDEDKTHFTMWCMLNSPLLAGNDLRKMSAETIDILTNKEVIALNQDKGFSQAQRIYKEKNVEVWVKVLGNDGKDGKAIAIMNIGEKELKFELNSELVNLKKSTEIRDLWLHKNLGRLGKQKTFTIPKHGVIVFKTL